MTSKNKTGDIREARNVLLSEVKPEHYHHVWTLLYEIEELRESKEYCKRLVGELTYENAVLKGEKPITVHLNGGDD